jgi:hypothetical protein
MTFDQILMLGGLIAATIAGLLGIRRGDTERKKEEQLFPLAQVMPTYADNARLDRNYEATLKLSDAMERIAHALEEYMMRQNQHDRELERSQAKSIADNMARLADLLDKQDRRPKGRPGA